MVLLLSAPSWHWCAARVGNSGKPQTQGQRPSVLCVWVCVCLLGRLQPSETFMAWTWAHSRTPSGSLWIGMAASAMFRGSCRSPGKSLWHCHSWLWVRQVPLKEQRATATSGTSPSWGCSDYQVVEDSLGEQHLIEGATELWAWHLASTSVY